MFSLELVGSPVALVVVPVIPLELVEPVVPVMEPVALIAVFRLPLELMLKLDVGRVPRVPLVDGGVVIYVLVLEVTVAVPDIELRIPVDEEMEPVVVVVVESALAFEVGEEPGPLVEIEPENVDIDCMGPALGDDTEILMQNGSEQVCDDETGYLMELVRDGVEFDMIVLAWEDDMVDSVFCNDIETLRHSKSEQDGEADVGVGDMLELAEDGTGFDVIELAWEDTVD